MTDEVPFSEAERVFNKVLDLVADNVESKAPGAGVVSYTFCHMAGLVEHRRIVGMFTDRNGLEEQFIVVPPASTGFEKLHQYDIRLDLTSQEVELLTDLVWLGACAGFWYVENLADVHGHVQQRRWDPFMGTPEPPKVDPLAILAAFAGGTMEELWPQRKAIFEKGWLVWQARHQAMMADWEEQIAAQGGGRAKELWPEEAADGTPDYLL